MYPEIADSYLDTISDPMDFRTIEDVRLDKYRHIHELQDDLILTFRNVSLAVCIRNLSSASDVLIMSYVFCEHSVLRFQWRIF
jgi:hypothetical protein